MANSNRLALHLWLTMLRLLCTTIYMGFFIGLLPVLVFLWLNDMFMLTLDFRQTHTYVGSILVQGIFSLFCIVSTIVLGGILSIPLVFISLLLLLLIVRPAMLAQPRVPIGIVWAINSKDLILGFNSTSGRPKLAWKGDVRIVPLPRRRRLLHLGMVATRKVVQNFITNVFFRRVSPAENELYAFVRNTFAVIFMAVIIWRASVSLSRAQSAFETRMLSETCWQPQPDISSVQMLIRNMNSDKRVISGVAINVTSSVTFGGNERPCSSRPLPSRAMAFDDWNITTDWYTVFDCSRPDVTRAYGEISIRMQSLSGVLEPRNIPHIWISNKVDTFEHSFDKGIDESEMLKSLAPWFTPSWQLKQGLHLNGTAGFVTRRFVTSSLFHDVILQKEPIHQEIAMYPISTTRTSPLGDDTTATGTILLSFQQMPIFKSRVNYSDKAATDLCNYIEDYRSSTIFDIVGSIGGLFALLQSLHVVLFGRPMLWGLTGAKLISPFGLLGLCSTKNFKKRLRDEYHGPAPHSASHDGDAMEAIRLGALLRDFVIDFGPAEVEDKLEGVNPNEQPTQAHERRESELSGTPLLPTSPVSRLSTENSVAPAPNDASGRV